MSAATINLHGIVSATAQIREVNDTKWLVLEFADEDGDLRSVTLFSTDPQALLDSIAGRTDTTEDRLRAHTRVIEAREAE